MTKKEVRKVLLEINRGVWHANNGNGIHKAVYLINIENAFARVGVFLKPKKK